LTDKGFRHNRSFRKLCHCVHLAGDPLYGTIRLMPTLIAGGRGQDSETGRQPR
jgi:hypothetical protein